MPWETRTLEFVSPTNAFANANAMVNWGWQASYFEVVVEGWIWKRYVYRITFRRRVAPPRPGPVCIRTTAEFRLGETDMLTFFVDLPAKTAEEFDVAKRRVTVTVGGVAAEPVEVPVDTLEVGPFVGKQDATLKVECFNVDDAGNVSETASTFDGVLLDTFAPPAPGQIGVRVVGEQADPVEPPPVVEPPVVEPPVVDPPVDEPEVPEEPIA
jgi:hypothetical protein